MMKKMQVIQNIPKYGKPNMHYWCCRKMAAPALQENGSTGTKFFILPNDLAVPGGNGNMLNKRQHHNQSGNKSRSPGFKTNTIRLPPASTSSFLIGHSL